MMLWLVSDMDLVNCISNQKDLNNTRVFEFLPLLRDFFSAVDGKALKSAATAISHHFGMPLGVETNWIDVEYDFNRLFVGPATVPAPPYASAYQDDPTLMGEPALAARDAYRQLGLAVPNEGAIPDDHLAFELDAALAMHLLATIEEYRGNADLAALRAWFIVEHMGQWVPKFTQAVLSQERVSQPVSMAVNALLQWLSSEKHAVASAEKELQSLC
jgi:TorA maturation chaperone TorD